MATLLYYLLYTHRPTLFSCSVQPSLSSPLLYHLTAFFFFFLLSLTLHCPPLSVSSLFTSVSVWFGWMSVLVFSSHSFVFLVSDYVFGYLSNCVGITLALQGAKPASADTIQNCSSMSFSLTFFNPLDSIENDLWKLIFFSIFFCLPIEVSGWWVACCVLCGQNILFYPFFSAQSVFLANL